MYSNAIVPLQRWVKSSWIQFWNESAAILQQVVAWFGSTDARVTQSNPTSLTTTVICLNSILHLLKITIYQYFSKNKLQLVLLLLSEFGCANSSWKGLFKSARVALIPVITAWNCKNDVGLNSEQRPEVSLLISWTKLLPFPPK